MVTIRLFAAAADAVGSRQLEGAWAGLTVSQLLARLAEEHPRLARIAPSLATAVNREYAEGDRVLQEGDELALIPPVSGGSAPPLFEVTEKPLSADEVAARVTNPYSGATLVFVGTVREWTKGKRTTLLEYEAYAEMAEEQMKVIGREIEERWPGARTAIVHRVGRLEVTEPSVIIAVATPHRADAFDACRHAIERLKQIVPIWKKEIFEDGEEWVGSQLGPDWMHKK
ncbi:MAG TPA: molybdenum cofactor biosynthesis protein MoaE [Symbiobacteriaceae bacterium]|nr:molybdenum cofactor biosynthesis protein MoaE [Symbiobacteriaceae bacterium]